VSLTVLAGMAKFQFPFEDLEMENDANDAQYQIPGAYPVMVVQVYINRLIYPVQNGMSMMDTEWHGRHVFLIIFKSKFLWIENI
jgi:hypothetical protein